MKSSSKPPRKHGHNVLELPVKNGPVAEKFVESRAKADAADEIPPGGAAEDDARVQEAMRLAQVFLAIEDATARSALVALAERLVSYDWVRKVK